jgi:hypothetical protein
MKRKRAEYSAHSITDGPEGLRLNGDALHREICQMGKEPCLRKWC